MRTLLVSALASLAFAGSASATIFGGDDVTNNYHTTNNQGGTGVGIAGAAAGAAAISGSNSSANVGDIRNTNNATGGSVLGSGNSANDVDVNNRVDTRDYNANLGVNLQAQGIKNSGNSSSTSAGGDANQSQSAVSGVEGSGNSNVAVDGNNSAQTTEVNVAGDAAQKRNPVATAVAFGSGGGGACPRFGPGVGVQTIGAGVSLSLPIFKDVDCVTLQVADRIAVWRGNEAAFNYLWANLKSVRDALSEAN